MVILTKNSMQKMKEDDLREQVIGPLLEKMGFFGVFEWHGGPAEHGKDFVFWKRDALGNRQNLAIVAKATALSTNPQLHDLAAQVIQAFTSSYRDPGTGEVQRAQSCWVVTNKRLGKEARGRIWATVPEERHRWITLIDGGQLWTLIEQYLPVKLHQALDVAQQHLANLETDFKVRVSLTGSERQIEVSEGYPGQLETEPQEFSLGFAFPDNSESQAKREELRSAYETGSTAVLPREYIQQFGVPKGFQRLLQQVGGVDSLEFDTLRISSWDNPNRVPLSIEFECDDGDRASLPYVEMSWVQQGVKEMTLSNDAQALPIRVKLVLGSTKEWSTRFRLNFGPKSSPIAAPILLQLLRVQQCMRKAGHLRISLVDPGLILANSRYPGEHGTQMDPEMMELATDLAAIQEKIMQPIYVPDQIAGEAWKTIGMLRSLLRNPVILGTWTGGTATCFAQDAEAVLADYPEGEDRPLLVPQEERATLFENDLWLGRVLHVYDTARVVNHQEIREQAAAIADAETEITLRLEPGTSNRVRMYYLDWGAVPPDSEEGELTKSSSPSQ